MTLWCWFLGLSVARVKLFPPVSLAFDGASSVQLPGLAIRAGVILVLEVLIRGHSTVFVDVITFRVLPCVASVAVDSIPIVVLVAADALDGVVFWLLTLDDY